LAPAPALSATSATALLALAALLALTALLALVALLALAALIMASAALATRLFCYNFVSWVSGKGGRASAGASEARYTADNAGILWTRIRKMCIRRVCTAYNVGLQNLVCMGNGRISPRCHATICVAFIVRVINTCNIFI
jgi:hypothetical protein